MSGSVQQCRGELVEDHLEFAYNHGGGAPDDVSAITVAGDLDGAMVSGNVEWFDLGYAIAMEGEEREEEDGFHFWA